MSIGFVTSTSMEVVAQTNPKSMRSIVVFNLESKDLSPDKLDTLSLIVRDEAQQLSQYKVVKKPVMSLAELTLALDCDPSDTACLKQTAEQIGEQMMVYGFINKEAGGWRIKLEMFDADAGKVTFRHQKVVPLQDDMVLAYRQEIEEFFGRVRADQQSATLIISSNVRGAQVLLDGKPAGLTPFENKQLKPKLYKIEVQKEGFSSWSAEMELNQGSTLRMSAKLKPLAPKTTPVVIKPATPPATTGGVNIETPKTTSSTNWGAISLMTIGGVALIASGVTGYLVSDTQDELNAKNQPGQLTQTEYDDLVNQGENYQLIHLTTLGVGAAAVLIGGVWWLIDDGSAPPSESALAPGWTFDISHAGAIGRYRW